MVLVILSSLVVLAVLPQTLETQVVVVVVALEMPQMAGTLAMLLPGQAALLVAVMEALAVIVVMGFLAIL